MTPQLTDAAARKTALTERHLSLLVEAGAGSGKTALMAGRVALLMADSVAPDRIAAITFTELAAAELADRIRTVSEDLLAGEVPIELEIALPDGASCPNGTKRWPPPCSGSTRSLRLRSTASRWT